MSWTCTTNGNIIKRHQNYDFLHLFIWVQCWHSCSCSCKKHSVHYQNWIVPVWFCGWWHSRQTELGLNRSQSKRIQTDSSLLFKRIVQSRVPSTTKPNWLKTSEHRRMMVLVTWAANATVARPLSAVSNVPLALCFSTVLRTVQTLLYNTRLPQISLWAIHFSWSKIWVHCIADKESSRNYFLILEFRLIRQTCHWKK